MTLVRICFHACVFKPFNEALFWKKVVLKNFKKFPGKRLLKLFFNEVVGLYLFYKTSSNEYFVWFNDISRWFTAKKWSFPLKVSWVNVKKSLMENFVLCTVILNSWSPPPNIYQDSMACYISITNKACIILEKQHIVQKHNFGSRIDLCGNLNIYPRGKLIIYFKYLLAYY